MAQQILIVDDSPSMRQMVAFTLGDAGYAVVEAVDGKDALGKLNADTKLIVTDINMPGMNGFELVKSVRSGTVQKFVPIIVLTTESDPAKQAEGKAAGATAWLVKPFTPEKLLETVKRVIG